jgi:hypothetical protein
MPGVGILVSNISKTGDQVFHLQEVIISNIGFIALKNPPCFGKTG